VRDERNSRTGFDLLALGTEWAEDNRLGCEEQLQNHNTFHAHRGHGGMMSGKMERKRGRRGEGEERGKVEWKRRKKSC
jgi:hypothetical protein